MTRLLYCHPSVLAEHPVRELPGIPLFMSLISAYGTEWVLPVDRSETVRTPIASASGFPVPHFRPFAKTFEELCDARAKEVLARADALDVAIRVMYSGGIDSTCVMVSLLKLATPEQKRRIIVLLTHESIAENPRFYEEHIVGKLRVESSFLYTKHLGMQDILLSGEHNDMVMGSEKIGALMHAKGGAVVHASYDRTLQEEFFAHLVGAAPAAALMDLFERICAEAPIPIRTNLEFLWWVNFVLKWQACYAYILLLTPRENAHLVTQKYLDERFVSFYNTEEFQLWSMHNPDLRIKDTWESYKWVAKDVIYAFTRDTEYRDHKVKNGSLIPVTRRLPSRRFITENLVFSDSMHPSEYIVAENDFVAPYASRV